MYRRLLLTILMIVVFISCDIMKGPENITNPYNPADPDFDPPQAIFDLGPKNGETIENCNIIFTWIGNAENMNFRFKLDNDIWSEWNSDKSIEYTLLDEGLHTF
ncbi:MAG: hypothetical protein U9R41_04200, partial [Candidatus Marinimicrobia bacterium]|nr:hypothetical protein [Candidatus Neomarinimicrobiota bacterium]